MNIKPGQYTVANSSLVMSVWTVRHVSDRGYVKFKGTLLTKTGHVLETKSYKLELKNIKRWVRVNA